MNHRLKSIIILSLMLAASGIAIALKPTYKLADQGPRVDLEKMIPDKFADWKIDTSLIPVTLSPDVQAQLAAIYNQTLSRTYINNKGQRIMLSIAYGGDQSGDNTQVHRPEFCYAAQGFQLSNDFESEIVTNSGMLPVRRLIAKSESRQEPITYWVTVGDAITLPGFSRKIVQLKYGLTGVVPDGLLFRVSSISIDAKSAYGLQDQFVIDLLNVASPTMRKKLIGRSFL
jgi:EpsI family protein